MTVSKLAKIEIRPECDFLSAWVDGKYLGLSLIHI